MSSQRVYDFIIIGGGTAGNVVAGRLAENPDIKILIIEAGMETLSDVPEITTPARAFQLRNSKYDWAYQTMFIDKPDYERLEKPNTRGKGLGGSSAVNHFTWTRGSKATFDAWSEFGGQSWTWDQCQKYFEMPASYHGGQDTYDTEFSRIGRNGPIHIAHADLLPETKQFREALIKAWTSMGYLFKQDMFDGKPEGLTHCVNSIYNGVRSSSAEFVKQKPNIKIMPMSLATKLNFEENVAKSVTVLTKNRTEIITKARYEIILCAGVFETPKLLLLSGIGPRVELARHGISPIVESEHVGENLLDHPILPHVFRLKHGTGLDDYILRRGPAYDAAVQQYNNDKTGPLASGLLEMIAFPRIDIQLEKHKEYLEAKQQNEGKDPFGPEGQPHFEIDFLPMFAGAFQWHFPVPPEGDWLTVIIHLARPLSRNGYVRLHSVDPHEEPYINLKYFSNELDTMALKEGLRFIDNIVMNGDGMKDIIHEDYPWPIPRNSDEEMDQMILDRSQTGFHPCGTARLSLDIKQGVVDPQLTVHGVQNLRIVDSSVIPVIPDCRIQNTVYMIGEKGADLIKSSHPSLFSYTGWADDITFYQSSKSNSE